jgi:hypothetical protein
MKTMGMYDVLVSKCPHCGQEAEAQTKIGHNCLDIVTEGKPFGLQSELPDAFILESKANCKCGGKLIAQIQDRKFTGFTKMKPELIESVFGSILKAVES